MILDSSVIFKWFFAEEGTDRALLIYQDIKEEKINLSLPRLLMYEIGNIVLNHKPYSQEKIIVAREILETLPLSFHDFTFRQWREIIEEAHHFQISFYDCAYIYLARQLSTDFITADKKLFEKTKKLGFVKLL